MKSRLRRKFRSHRHVAELNITAFMNLMVILVPFLLITAVFSRITILELHLPPPSNSNKPSKPSLELEVIVRAQGIDVQDRNQGYLVQLPNQGGGYDTRGLSSYLRRVKAQYPEITSASILLEPDTAYETLVLMMDTVRAYEAKEDNGTMVRAELFPEIAIGDAPLLAKVIGSASQ